MTDSLNYFSYVSNFVAALPQAQRLEIEVISARKNIVIMKLPYSRDIVGNADSGVIHGGSITTLMDTACGSAVMTALPSLELCPTLDLRVDYMGVAKPGEPVYARAYCYHVTSNIMFMRCEAYQADRSVAQCVGTFMRLGKSGVKAMESMQEQTAAIDFSEHMGSTSSGELAPVLERARKNRSFNDLVNVIPYAQFIGISFDDDSGENFKLSAQPSNIGNPVIPAIHGGVMGGFMEMAAAMHLLVCLDTLKYPKIIDFSIDYLQAGLNKDTFAYCEITRQGSRVANVEVHAWQDDKSKPIALARAHFLLAE